MRALSANFTAAQPSRGFRRRVDCRTRPLGPSATCPSRAPRWLFERTPLDFSFAVIEQLSPPLEVCNVHCGRPNLSTDARAAFQLPSGSCNRTNCAALDAFRRRLPFDRPVVLFQSGGFSYHEATRRIG